MSPDSYRKSLAILVENFGRRSREERDRGISETETRRQLIDPLFEALGWDVANRVGAQSGSQEVIHEYRGGNDGGSADYAFCDAEMNVVMIVEAKRPAVKLYAGEQVADLHFQQIAGYRSKFGRFPAIAVLTNFDDMVIYEFQHRRSMPKELCRFHYNQYLICAEGIWDRLARVHFGPLRSAQVQPNIRRDRTGILPFLVPPSPTAVDHAVISPAIAPAAAYPPVAEPPRSPVVRPPAIAPVGYQAPQNVSAIQSNDRRLPPIRVGGVEPLRLLIGGGALVLVFGITVVGVIAHLFSSPSHPTERPVTVETTPSSIPNAPAGQALPSNDPAGWTGCTYVSEGPSHLRPYLTRDSIGHPIPRGTTLRVLAVHPEIMRGSTTMVQVEVVGTGRSGFLFTGSPEIDSRYGCPQR